MPGIPRQNALEPSDHALLRKLLHDRTGVVLDPSRDYFVEMRLGALATEAGFPTLPDVMASLCAQYRGRKERKRAQPVTA